MARERQGFADALLGWYASARRDLPWRRTRDPYAIMVSEFMLQQTQVKTVIPYYERFLTRFPTVTSLANAPQEQVLLAWQGLGYYRRARHLQETARQIQIRHGGRFPQQLEQLAKLKGIGPYTAAAVASIAFGVRSACVDGNVARVLSRVMALDEDVQAGATKKRIATEAQSLISHHEPGDFNQAMMELGATICTPREPCCLTCPVQTLCRTFQAGEDPHTRPFKAKRVRVSQIRFESLFLFFQDRFLLAKRADGGLMGGMWELPSQAADQFQPWGRILSTRPAHLGYLPKPVLHKFTHLHATYRVGVYRGEDGIGWQRQPTAYSESRWFQVNELKSAPLTKVLQKLVPQLKPYLEGVIPCPNKESTLPGMHTTN